MAPDKLFRTLRTFGMSKKADSGQPAVNDENIEQLNDMSSKEFKEALKQLEEAEMYAANLESRLDSMHVRLDELLETIKSNSSGTESTDTNTSETSAKNA